MVVSGKAGGAWYQTTGRGQIYEEFAFPGHQVLRIAFLSWSMRMGDGPLFHIECGFDYERTLP